MSFYNDILLDTALSAKEATIDRAGTQTAFLTSIGQAIETATIAGLFTATVAMSTNTSADIQFAISALRQLGYIVTTSTTNIVISWA